jgi:hypothetical protein
MITKNIVISVNIVINTGIPLPVYYTIITEKKW